MSAVLRLLPGTGGAVGITADDRAVTVADLDGSTRFRWGLAPAGLATRRQLSALGLRPAGQAPVAQVVCRAGRRWADLYRLDRAAAKRPVTPGRARALAAALAARRRCPVCGRDAGYVVPTSLGSCLDCHAAPTDAPTDSTADGAARQAA